MLETLPKSHEAREKLKNVVSNMDRYDKLMLLMRYADKLNDREIAAVLETTVDAVRTRMARTLRWIRQQIGEKPAKLV